MMYAMREENASRCVVNTTPLIALTAATGTLDVLRFLYSQILPDFCQLCKISCERKISHYFSVS